MTAPVFEPTGRPVLRAGVAIGLIAVVAAASWWLGLLAPRLHSTSGPVRYDQAAARGTVVVSVVNQAPLPVRITGVGGAADTVSARLVGDEVEVPGNGDAEVRLAVTVDCTPGGDHRGGLAVEVRTPSGRHRPAGVDWPHDWWALACAPEPT